MCSDGMVSEGRDRRLWSLVVARRSSTGGEKRGGRRKEDGSGYGSNWD